MEGRKIRVLVVDDEKIIRDFFSRLLSAQGLEVVSAEDGYKALELAKAGKFNLYFLDVRMPGMDGLQTYRRLRQIDSQGLIVMMTGYAVEEVLQQAVKEGAYGAIRKPFDISEIKGIIDKIAAERREPLNILAIDDDEAVLGFFANLLKNKNQKYTLAKNKEEAISAVKKEKFDLIYLDLVLKDTSGDQLYKEIKNIVPDAEIIMMTGYPEKLKMIEGEVKIEACLYKPFDIEKILGYIAKVKAKIK